MTKIYVALPENTEENELVDFLIGSQGAYYTSMKDLLEDADNSDGNSVFVLEVVDRGTIKTDSKFVSDKVPSKKNK